MGKVFSCFLLLSSFSLIAQFTTVDSFKVEDLNWPNKNLEQNQILGTGVNRVYEELITDKKSKQTVIVAVIDGGVYVEHEDLKDKIWVNEDEIPNNGIDDDKNGYIDDINGWNFIGGADGKNVLWETLELTRIVRSNDRSNPDFNRAYEAFKKMRESKTKAHDNLMSFKNVYDKTRNIIQEETGIEVTTLEDLEKVNSTNQQVQNSKAFLEARYKGGYYHGLIEEVIESQGKYLNYYLNKNHDPRDICGDNVDDIEDMYYGNNDVASNRSSHGTSVAGVIAAVRDNNLGIDGIANNVKIMAIRSTPDGDERDKDVALAIRYAVDNGAHIINMSFGKGFSPQKQFVDEAVKYATEKGVLLVHSAGNEGKNTDEEASFPCATYLDGSKSANWVSVGASDRFLKKDLIAPFSNYGENTVSIFAPGVEIVSLDSSNHYSQSSGTSIAGPIYAGVAALVWSYFPDLSATELIALLNETSTQIIKPKKVLLPNPGAKRKTKVKFNTTCQSAGVVNAFAAFQKLMEP